ncbi:MAG: protein kinase [Sandaracinaceae bacterium]
MNEEGESGDDLATVAEPGAPPPPRRASMTEGDWIGNRYRVRSLIGRGGFGEVYRVADTLRDGRDVALKLHRRRAMSRAALQVLKSEFALLASLSHPNLAPVHDFAFLPRKYAFFTQTLMAGRPLHHAGVDPRTKDGALLLVQLCRALDYLHGRGVVHGDIKPGNVVVDPAHGHLTLLDFGIARALGSSNEDVIVGSPSYMAPELITTGVADVRTDLYALGMTLYQLVCGGLPFRGSTTEVFRAQVTEEVGSLIGRAPLPLVTLIARLLSKDPMQRPGRASEVLEALARGAGLDAQIDTEETLASHVLSSQLVGREAELDRLLRWGLHDTPGRPLAVLGAAGMGKSRLLSEARRRVQLAGRLWIQVPTARGVRGVLPRLARAVLGPREVAALDEEERLELARALPELRHKRERLALPLDPAEARARRRAILASQIAGRFRRQPGVLVLEDLDRAPVDEQREAVEVLNQARAESPCRVVVSGEQLSPEVVAALDSATLELGPLAPVATRALLVSILGRVDAVAGTEFERRVQLEPVSPLWIQESLRWAFDAGRIRRHGGRFEAVGPLPSPDLSEVVQARLAHRSRDAQTAALGCAVLAHAALAAEVARTSGLSTSRTSNALHELVNSGIAERREDARGRARYVMQERYAEGVLDRMPARRIRAARRRLGRWMVSHHDGDARHLDRAATELEAAGDMERARSALQLGGAVAEQSGRPGHAVDLLEREAALRAPDDPAHDRALLRIYDLATRTGRPASAGNALMRMADLASRRADPRLGAAVLIRGARQSLRGADVADATRQVDNAMAALARGVRGPPMEQRGLGLVPASQPQHLDLRSELCILRGQIEAHTGSPHGADQHFREAARLALEAERVDLFASARLESAMMAVRLGDGVLAADAAHEAADAAARAKDPVLRSNALRMLGNAHFIGGRRGRALTAFRRAVRVARQSGGAESEAKALNNVATCSHARGDIRGAIEAWQRSVLLKERVGVKGAANLTRASMSSALTMLGRWDEAEATQAIAIAAEGHLVSSGLAWSNRGDLEALRSRIDDADDAYANGSRQYREAGMNRLRVPGLSGWVRVLWTRGARGDAERAGTLEAELEELTQDAAPEDRRRWLTARAIHLDGLGRTRDALKVARAAARLTVGDTGYDAPFGSVLDARWMSAVFEHRLGQRAHAQKHAASARAWLQRKADALARAEDRVAFLDLPCHRAVLEARFTVPLGRSW